MEEEIQPPKTPVIEDRHQIAQIAEFLVAHGRGWREPRDTFPRCHYYILLESNQGPAFHLWVGGNWIGGPVGMSNQLVRVSEEEMGEFRDLLGIPHIR